MEDIDIGILYGMETMVSNAQTMNEATSMLSVLAANVSGSSRLQEKLGQAEAMRAVDRCIKRMERTVGAFRGRVVKIAGDELIAVFALSDDALQSAIEMQQRVADLPPVSGIKLAVRAGLSHGEADEETNGTPGDLLKEARHLSVLAIPGRILASRRSEAALSAAVKSIVLRNFGSACSTASAGGEEVFEIVMDDQAASPEQPESKAADKPDVTGAPRAGGNCLRLRYAGETLYLNDRKTAIRMGRDAGNDVVVKDRRASRNHARIERRGESVVLIDKSTNGTFVVIDGLKEIALRHDECVLHGKGLICFASSSANPNADFAEFELT